MRSRPSRLVYLSLLPLFACAGFADYETFDALPTLEYLDYAGVVPAGSPFIWELREGHGWSVYSVVGGGGRDAKDTLSADVRLAFDSIGVGNGFAPGCPPAQCFFYVASLDATGVHTWTTPAALVEFLGAIDSPVEAALVALAAGYRWGTRDQSGSIRASPAGFELIVLRTVSDCPFQVNRFLIEVSASGAVRALKDEVASQSEGCPLAAGPATGARRIDPHPVVKNRVDEYGGTAGIVTMEDLLPPRT